MGYIRNDELQKLMNNTPDAPTEIDFSDTCGVQASCVLEVAQILRVNTTVESYKIGNNEMSEEGLVELSAALCQNSTLKKLDLNYQKITDPGMQALASMLTVNHAISELNISGCKFSPESFQFFSRMLAENSTITDLNLSRCELSTENFKLLANSLRVNRGIKTIDLTFTKPDFEGLKELIDALKTNNILINLFLSGNNFTNEQAELLANLLSTNKTLQSLSLTHSNINDDIAEILAKGIENNQTLISLNFFANKLGSRGVKAIANSLAHNKALNYLNLKLNKFSFHGRAKNKGKDIYEGQGARALGEMLRTNQCLKSLALGFCSINDNDGAAILSGVIDNPVLEKLDLEHNALSKESTEVLTKILQSSRNNLHILDLSNNKFKTQDAKDMAEAAKNNRSLIVLKFQSNKISDEGALAWKNVVKKTNLVHLDLLGNPIADEWQGINPPRTQPLQAYKLLEAVYKNDLATVEGLLKQGTSPYFLCYKNSKSKRLAPDEMERNKFSYKPFSPDSYHPKVLPEDGGTLLHIAIQQQHLQLLKVLLQHKMAFALMVYRNKTNQNALQLAEAAEDPRFLQAFIDAKLFVPKRAAGEENESAPLPAKRLRREPNRYLPIPQ